VEGQETVHLPTMGQYLGAMRRTGNFPDKHSREIVASVEVAIAVFRPRVSAVNRDHTAVGGNVVERVRPGVFPLRAEAMPRPRAEGRLQRVVIRITYAIELVDVVEIRKRRIRPCRELSELINVQHDRKLVASAAHISYLEHCAVTEALLHVEVVVVKVRCPEVLANGEDVERGGPAIWVCSNIARHAGSHSIEDVLVGLPRV